MFKSAARWLSVPVAVFALVGWSQLSVAQEKKAEGAHEKNIVETAKGAGFNTLAKLIDAAGLTETLTGKGPFTVFAPTDEAFNKLGKEKLDELMKPENKAKLAGILKHHVVAGKHMAADVTKMKSVKTMGGEEPITTGDAGAMIGPAKITKTDVAASNGVIHVIDSVLMPKAHG